MKSIPLLITVLLLACLPATAQDTYFDPAIINDSAFAAFKQNAVETGCVVERIGEFPSYGAAAIGAEGGAKLSDEEAQAAYDCAKSQMRNNYARSSLKPAANYQNWRRFSRTPYASRAHSRRYVNNYASPLAAEHYARFEQIEAGEMPVGAWLAKDSLVVTESGRVAFGALALMEKMPPGFSPATGDWRFSLVLPDGRLFGSTNTVDQVTVEFCAECHKDAGPEQDFMFFMPKRYRITQAKSEVKSDDG